MKRAVITGIGVVCAIGKNADHFWDSASEGVCGIAGITIFDTSGYRVHIAAEVPEAWIPPPPRGTRRLSRSDLLGLGALDEALQRSGIILGEIPPERRAVIIGSGSGGLRSAELFKRVHMNGGNPAPSLLVPFSSSSFTDLVASRCGSQGFRTTISTACSSSSTALGYALDLIRGGRADVVVSGGTESLSETTFAGFNSLRAVDESPCRPFDRDRRGISLGEGAAMFIVEERERALKRKAAILAEIAGYGITGDAYHVTSPEPEGRGISYAIDLAFESSGLRQEDIGYINAHGTGTPANDLAETVAIKNTFGPLAYGIPVSSTKSMIGHCLGAAGALEAAASVLPFLRGVLPPTVHYENADPLCDLDYVPVPVTASVDSVLSLSLAFGGNNTALLLRRHA